MKASNHYQGTEIILTTKHSKGVVIGPIFANVLGAKVLECNLDTDSLGTFSGEIQREEPALQTAKHKCLWGIESMYATCGLASEGSFGPHPLFSFTPCDHEILYFIDKSRDFNFHMSIMSQRTNYWTGIVKSIEEVEKIFPVIKFPSHALVIRPNQPKKPEIIFKGINSYEELNHALNESIKYSADSNAWVETDMRAHMNPTRMEIIGELATSLAIRLASQCEVCNYPGWGITNAVYGLPCEDCGLPTDIIKAEVFSCVKCPHSLTLPASHGLSYAAAKDCKYCNP